MAATIDTIEINTVTLNFLFEEGAMKYDFSIFVKILFSFQTSFLPFQKIFQTIFKIFFNEFPTQ